MEQESLKPCPFCGSEANYWEYEDEYDIYDPVSLGYVSTGFRTIHCIGCDVCEIVISRNTKNDTVTAWNTRHEHTCTMEVYHGDHGPEPRFEGDGWTMSYVCSECHGHMSPGDAYCKHCGARVVSE